MTISGSETLLYEKKGKIVVITINRPERLNAFEPELARKLEAAWRDFSEDEDAWVAIITGAGDKAFCAGADLQEGFDLSRKQPSFPLRPSPRNVWKPTIAAINGYALAGGFWIAMDCDIRIAAEHAEFGIGETKWNVPAFWVHNLAREMHLAHALEIALWGDKRMSAQRGYEIGWINKVVPREKLMEEAMDWAERMLYLGPQCVRNLKEIIYRSYYMPPSEAEAFATALEQNLVGMEDTIEGPRAFAEKRKPVFKNK